MQARLFHLVPPDAWRRWRSGDDGRWRSGDDEPWRPPSLASEGFCHLSFAAQLAGTLAAHFAEGPAPLLLEVERAAVAGDLRLERSRGGALFPHVHGPLPRRAFRACWDLARGPAGWSLPALGPDPAQDRPAGRDPFA